MADIPNGNGSQKISAFSNLVSIIIPCCGQLEYTKLCVPSVLRHSRGPLELIFIDIGSLDGTVEYLAGLAAGVGPRVRVEVVRTPTDQGIADAVREAIDLARGEYIVLLNNDTIVTPGWLNQLIGLAGLGPHIGMVGPMSNQAAPPQLVDTVPYRLRQRDLEAGRLETRDRRQEREGGMDVEGVTAFAKEWREQHQGKWLEAERLGGFCVLIKRQVLAKIDSKRSFRDGRSQTEFGNEGGALDDWNDLGLFDSDILSAKARQAGFTLAVCRDLFVHHFGSRTFAHGAPA